MWELKTGKILVFDKVCRNTNCGRSYKSPKTGYKTCPDCMSESPVKVLLKAYSDIAYDREVLIKRVSELENLIGKMSEHYEPGVGL